MDLNLEDIGVVLTIIATIGAGILFILKIHKEKVEKDRKIKELTDNFNELKNKFIDFKENNFTGFKKEVEKEVEYKVKTSHDQINSEKDKLQAEIKALDQKFLDKVENAVKTSHDKIHSEKDKLQDEIKSLDQKLLDKLENEVKTSHDKINSEKEKLLDEIKNIDQKLIEKVENEVKTSSDKINTDKDQLQEEIKALDQKLDKVETLDQDFTKLKEKVENIETLHNKVNTEKDQLQKEIKDIQDQYDKVFDEIDDVKQDAINKVKNTVSNVEEKFNELNIELDDDTKQEIVKPIDKKIAQVQVEIERINHGMKTIVKAISRYIDNGDGTITDKKTGLIWLKNANCFSKQSWEDATRKVKDLKSGEYDLSDNSRAGDWRLPTKEEWEKMVDNYEKPAISKTIDMEKWQEDDAFSSVRTYCYWSSSICDIDNNAWFVRLNNGSVNCGNKSAQYYVWPVRDGQ